MKRTFVATLLILAACGASAAQGSRVNRQRTGGGRLPRAGLANADGLKGSARDADIDGVIERNAMAEGGAAKLLVKSRITRGRIEMSASDLPGTYECYEKLPGKKLEVINAPAGQFIEAADGSKRWTKAPWNLSESLPDEGEAGEGGAGGGPLWKRFFTSASLRGRAVVDGRETVVLAGMPKGKGARPIVLYYDAETWLLRKQEFGASGKADDDALKAVYVDSYADVDGVKVPTVYRQVYAKLTLTFRIYEVKHNVPIDDALFRNPNGK